MLRFTKMNGAGNDFILLDNRTGAIDLDRNQIAYLCDRHRGIGADGILLLEKPENGADFRMRYFNADGGEAEMCGNGARCFARFANKVGGGNTKISFETPAGVISAELKDDLVTLQMTEPTDLRLNIDLQVAGKNKTVHFVNSGVPHVVIPVAKIDDADVRGEGAAIRYHKMFSPNGTNVNFIEKRGPKKIAVRTYERGVEDEFQSGVFHGQILIQTCAVLPHRASRRDRFFRTYSSRSPANVRQGRWLIRRESQRG